MLVMQYKIGEPPTWTIGLANFIQDGPIQNMTGGTGAGIFMRQDGLKQYFINQANDRIYSFSMSPAWDVSTLSYDGFPLASPALTTQTSAPIGAYFRSDGLRVYVLSDSTTNRVHEYSMSPAWDLTSMTHVAAGPDISGQQTNNWADLTFNSTGTTLICHHSSTGASYQYTLSVAWDITTMSYASKSFNPGVGANTHAHTMSSDGTKLYYVVQTGSDTMYEHDLGTAWDLSTVNGTATETLLTGSTVARGLKWREDTGTSFFIYDGFSLVTKEYKTF